MPSQPKIRRISLFGGSGIGKSTLSAYLFAEMKTLGYNIEQVMEGIKEWAYLRRPKKGFDVVYLFAEQIYREDIVLQHGVDYIVTDSPILLQSFYSDMIGHCTTSAQIQIAREFEKAYPSLNILLRRDGIPFSPIGRYENSLEEALALDKRLEEFLTRQEVPYTVVDSIDRNVLLETVVTRLK